MRAVPRSWRELKAGQVALIETLEPGASCGLLSAHPLGGGSASASVASVHSSGSPTGGIDQIEGLAQQHFGAASPNRAQDMGAMAKGLFKDCPAEGSLAGTLAETKGQVPFAPSKSLAEMQNCLQKQYGVFNMHGGIMGNQWAEWIRNPDNKLKYQAVGNKYADQRAFKAPWLANVTNALETSEREEWMTTTGVSTEDEMFAGT